MALLLAALACQIPGEDTPSSPASPSEEQKLFDGITYTREVRTSPRLMVIHVIQIDLRTKGIRLFVTPGHADRELPYDAQTTSQFLETYDLQVAINGDGFTPWSANPLDPYPKAGDPVDPLGLAISESVTYSEARDNLPTLYISPNGKVSLNDPPGNIAYAISGLDLLLQNGKVVAEDNEAIEPRTALGLNRAGRILTLLLVDGRQPGYSEGATLQELAALLLEYGVHDGMNMDGGGSTTLVIEGPDGQPLVLNSPIDSNLPGRERPVANHLGIFAK
jgi:hypothetical protein